MNRRVGTLLASGLLFSVSLTAMPGTAMADPGSSAQSQAYVCNVGDSDSTATVQTNDIHSAAEALPAFLPMRLTNCHLAS
ncbi:hypothetical protein ABIA32_005520 [Streptacidiphilus sp. MAP12-20]|uniref:hypothetical protein n=1 Tax=Streptacidiphilus sp. MAP12-20 TaxID=3156299 RepID=UPI0035198BE8